MSTSTFTYLAPLYGQQKAPHWRNVDFTTDGRHIPSLQIFDSEDVAKAHADTFAIEADAQNEEAMRRYGLALEIVDHNGCHLYWWPEYSHTIQLPAGKA